MVCINLYTDIDDKQKLIPCSEVVDANLSGLGREFWKNAKLYWSADAERLLCGTLGLIEDLTASFEVVCTDPEYMSFYILNKSGRYTQHTSVKLNPTSDSDMFPSLIITKNGIAKRYEVLYIPCINKFYLNLTVVTVKDMKTIEKLSRRCSENEISISFNKDGNRVEIKVRRPKDVSKDHFMIDNEEEFLNGLVKLKNIFNPEVIWEYFDKNSGLDLSQLAFQMDFFSLDDKQEFDSKKTFKFGFEIRDGKPRVYKDLLEKHANISEEYEQRLALLPKSGCNIEENGYENI